MERIPVGNVLLFASKVHPRGGHNKTLGVMALVMCLALSPSGVYFIAVRAVVRLVVGHKANPSASICCRSTSLFLSMFDMDTLCFRRRNQWYSLDAAIDKPFVKVWLLLSQGAGVFIGDSQGQAEG